MKCPEMNDPFMNVMRRTLGSKVAFNTFKLNNDHTLDKAPNGKTSILYRQLSTFVNPDYALQVKAATFTDEFKKWFRESGLKDANGEPKIFYHYKDNIYNRGVNPKLGQTSKDMYFFRDLAVPEKGMQPVFLRGGNTFVAFDISHITKDISKLRHAELLTMNSAPNTMYKVSTASPISIISSRASIKENFYVTHDIKNVKPIFRNGEFDGENMRLHETIPVFNGKASTIALEGARSSAQLFPTDNFKEASANARLFSGPVNKPLAERFDKVNNRKLGSLLLRAVKQFVPDVVFHDENNESSIEQFGEIKEAWVDNAGEIHVNLDKITPETAIHELGHVIEPMLEKYYPEAYNNALDEMNRQIMDQSGVSYEVFKYYYDKPGFESKKTLMKEVFAETLAISTTQQVKSLLAKNGNNEDNPQTLFDKVQKFFKGLRTAAKKLFSTMFNGNEIETLEDFGNLLANQLVTGGQLKLTTEDKNLLTNYFNSEGVMFRQGIESEQLSKIQVSSLVGINKMLIGESYSKTTQLSRALKIVNKKLRNAGDEDSITIEFNGDYYTYSSKLTPEVLAGKVIEDIIIPSDKLKESIKDKIVAYKDVDDFNELLGKNTTPTSINKLKEMMGLNGTILEIAKYSNLKDSDDPQIRALYNPLFVGYDPIVVVHNVSNTSGIAVSIVDITSVPLTERYVSEGDGNIFNSHYTDKQYYNAPAPDGSIRKFGLKLADSDLRNLSITMTAMNMMQATSGNVTFHRMGTLNVTTRKTRGNMIVDIEGMRNNVYILTQIPEIADGVLGDGLKKVLTAPEVYKYEPRGAALSMVISYLEDIESGKIEDPYFNIYVANVLEKLSTGDSEARYKILLAMKAHIEGFINPKDALSNDLYGYILDASVEIKQNFDGLLNDTKDITKFGKLLNSAFHVKSDYVQHVVNAVQHATFMITEKVMGDLKRIGGTTKNPGLARKVMQQSFTKNPQWKLKRYVADIGSDVYRHLYKTTVIPILKDGEISNETTEVTIPEIHWDINNKDTKAAIARGQISTLDIEFANELLDTMKERWLDYFIHENNMSNRDRSLSSHYKEYTREDAEKEFKKQFGSKKYPDGNKGIIPILEGSVSELLLNKNVKKAASKAVKQVEFSEVLFDDHLVGDQKMSDVFGRMSGFFMGQKDETSRMESAGLEYFTNDIGEEVLVAKDLARNQNTSKDIWKTFSYFDQSVIRLIEYETNVLPVARDSISLLIQLGDKKQKNNISYIEEYVNKNAFRKNSDDELTLSFLRESPIKVGAIARTGKNIINAATLPFKVSIGVGSLAFNMNKVINEGLASTIAESGGIMPSIKNFTKAMKFALNPKKVAFARELSLRNHVWGRDEMDILESPWINVTEYFVLNSMFTNILNWGTDTFARTITMLAVMDQDGSLDAFTYDSKSGEVGYDETKDLRFYDGKGNKKTDSKTLALYDGVMKDVMETQGLTERPSKLPFGYGKTDAISMKQMADTKIVGAFSADSMALMSNNWLGSLMFMYRQYLPVRFFNTGFFASERKTNVGQRIVAVPDGDGGHISKKQVAIITGNMQSVGKALRELYETRSYTPSEMREWYQNSDERTRHNLARSFVTVFQFIVLGGLYGWFGDDDDKWNKISWEYWAWRMITDVSVLSSIMDIAQDPLPGIDFILRIADKGELYKMLPYSAAAAENIDVINQINE